MGKDDNKKEESRFGFKDKAKALETIELLKSEASSYQSLTVRGLLGRAKRTLKLTKDTEKLKNISEAIQVFEEWIEGNKKSGSSDKKSPSKSEKKSEDKNDDDKKDDSKSKDDNSADTVPGLGFKDKEKALETIELLKGRDPDYQKLAVKGLVGRAKRVLTCTKDKDKLEHIQDAVKIFEKFLDDFEKLNMSKKNMTYLPLSVIESCMCLVKYYDLSMPRGEAFLEAYRSVDGQYKKLRTVEDDKSAKTWDIVRNKELNKLKKELDDIDLFEDDGNPTKDHLKMIIWAYSPQEARMKKIKITPPSEDADMNDEKNTTTDDQDEESGGKKRVYSGSSSDDDDDESPKKKRRH